MEAVAKGRARAGAATSGWRERQREGIAGVERRAREIKRDREKESSVARDGEIGGVKVGGTESVGGE